MPSESSAAFGEVAASSRAAKVLFVYSRASASLARNFRPIRPVPLDKSEGVVKTEISWAVREHRLLCQRRLRTKTLEISPESLCGGIVPPTIAYPDIVRIESSPRVPLVGAS